MSLRFEAPPFEPHPLLRNPHAQTLAGTYLPDRRFPYRAVHRHVLLLDGDTVVLHDDLPGGWPAGGRAALLLHGLAGCHSSAYMVRIAGKLNAVGVRTFRMDLRGCGAGEGLASHPYHAGRSDDAIAALQLIQKLCPEAPVTLVGFSLSGNIVLKLLGAAPDEVPPNVEKAIAVCPAVDLARCARSLVGPVQRIYDRHFVRLLCQQVRLNCRLRPDLPPIAAPHRLKTLLEFDDAYTGPVCGFGSADNYYATNSALRHIGRIRLPTLILAAQDDPLVPIGCFDSIRPSAHVLLHVTTHGGHLGYVGKLGVDPDRRWMDWRVVDWVTNKPSWDDGSHVQGDPQTQGVLPLSSVSR
jgi:uncharacterized protein